MKHKVIKIIKQINFHLFKLSNQAYVFFYRKKFSKSIAIVSCRRLKNKVKEDVYLKHSLNKLGIKADIIAWEDKSIDLKAYDALIIKSIWGFQHNLNAFYEWLDFIEQNNILLFNSVYVIRNSFDKEKQFMLLDKYEISHVDTIFLDNDNNINENVSRIWQDSYRKYDRLVIKPTISESGNDTYIISNEPEKNNIKVNDIKNKFQNVNSKLMLQPFIENINDGEISLTYISGKLTNAVIRYCDIFTNKNMAKDIELDKLDAELINLANKIIDIPEYKNNLYIRIDAVKTNKGYEIMEVELLDPNLFLTFIDDKRKRKETFTYFAESIIDRIGK